MSEEATQDWGISIELPASVVPQHGIAVVAFFDEDGDTCYAFRGEGDAPLSSVLGLLELAKHHLLTRTDE